jgi:predicted dehydrogenase
VEGGVHFNRAKPFLEAGLPCFIDKPFTCGVADAKKIVELAEKKKTVIFSSSSLRYTPDLVKFMDDKDRGTIQGVLAYGPASLHERNPGLYHYGVHAVEILYTVMGPGCQRLTCTHEKDVDVAIGQWKDGRVSEVRGIRPGGPYGVLAFTDKGAKHIPLDTKLIYRELLKKIVEFFDKKKAPVDPAETVEMMGFIEAALKSGNNHGAGEKVPT